MADDLNAKGKIEISIDSSEFDKLRRDLTELNQEFGGAYTGLDKFVGRLEAASEQARGTASGVDRATKSVKEYSRALKEVNANAASKRIEGMGAVSAGGATSESSFISAPRNNSLANGLEYENLKAAAQAGRNYLNTSTMIDGAIKQREESSKTFSAQLRAQMEAEQKANVATNKSATAMGRAEGSAITARYALYDVATTYGVVATAALGASGVVTKTAADFESAFTNVERTAGGSVDGLKRELIDMSTEIPRSFEEISDIATLGNQLGIAAGDVESFTGTVARFSTVTGMTIDASATAFGSLGELLNLSAADYEKLGSSIALVGRKSVATESEIVTLAQRLAASATNAGFSAEQVIALSGAFASLRIQPERAQGVMEKYFSVLNTALANGGPRLEAFAQYAGMTADEVQRLARNNPNQFFTELAAGLGKLDSVAQTRALQQLGLDGLRAGEVFSRVSGNLGVFTQALTDATTGYAQGSELSAQYALVLDDLNSKLTLLWNSFMALAAAGGTGVIPVLGEIIDHVMVLINNLRGFVDTPVGQTIAAIASGLAVIVGLFAGYAGVTALATASTYALVTAQAELGKMGAAGGIRGLIQAMFGLQAATSGATTRTYGLAAAFRTLRNATLVLALIGAGIELIFNFGGVMQWASDVLRGVSDWFYTLAESMLTATRVVGDSMGPFVKFFNIASSLLNMSLGTMFSGMADGAQGAADWANSGNEATKSADDFYESVKSLNTEFEAPAPIEYASGLDDVGTSAAGAAEEVRTLKDWANDLNGVFDRAFEIRFSGGTALDKITTGWRDISKATADAAEKMAEYRATLAGIAADKKIKEYWLSVAENYGDEKRAAKLRAELADLNNKQASASRDLAGAQSEASKELTGNSDAAIKNRATILGMVGSYQKYLVALAASGASQAELDAASVRLRAEFVRQAAQAGFSRKEIEKYAQSFDDMRVAIQKIPRNVTVDANADPALQALNEFFTKAKSKIGSGLSVPIKTTVDDYGAKRQANLNYLQATLASLTANITAGRIPISKFANTLKRIEEIKDKIAYGNYYTGGYVGDGGKYEPKGIVHGGEFVFSKAATQNLGVSNLAYMHAAAKRGKAVAPAGASIGGSREVMAYLSPADRLLLQEIRDSVGISLSGPALQTVVGAGAVNSSNRGGA